MDKVTRVDLEQGEAVVAQMASRILAAHMISNQCSLEDEGASLKKSIDLAVRLAKGVDDAVSSDSEVTSALSNDPNYRPLG